MHKKGRSNEFDVKNWLKRGNSEVLNTLMGSNVLLWRWNPGVTIQMKATGHEQYFLVVLFIMLHKVILTYFPSPIPQHTGKTEDTSAEERSI